MSVYLIVLIGVWALQEKLLFFPRPDDSSIVAQLSQDPNFTHIPAPTPDGIVLDGWRQNFPDRPKTLLFFDGNASNVTESIVRFSVPSANIIAYNYRGYGASEGNPSQEVLFSDALLLYDFLIQTGEITPENLYIMGRSLGTGVATYLASQRTSEGVILLTPFDSIEKIAKEQFPFLPVSLLIRNPFPSEQFASKKPNRVLMLTAEHDTLVRHPRTEHLFSVWNGEKHQEMIPSVNHDTIVFSEEVWKKIENFIQ